jgi:hypothetical protein
MIPQEIVMDIRSLTRQGGHDYRGDVEVHVEKRRRGRTARSLWPRMKRRAAIEPGNGHLKREHRMDRNPLKGTLGDQINAILSAAGMNFWKLPRFAAAVLRLFLAGLLPCQRALTGFAGISR